MALYISHALHSCITCRPAGSVLWDLGKRHKSFKLAKGHIILLPWPSFTCELDYVTISSSAPIACRSSSSSDSDHTRNGVSSSVAVSRDGPGCWEFAADSCDAPGCWGLAADSCDAPGCWGLDAPGWWGLETPGWWWIAAGSCEAPGYWGLAAESCDHRYSILHI